MAKYTDTACLPKRVHILDKHGGFDAYGYISVASVEGWAPGRLPLSRPYFTVNSLAPFCRMQTVPGTGGSCSLWTSNDGI